MVLRSLAARTILLVSWLGGILATTLLPAAWAVPADEPMAILPAHRLLISLARDQSINDSLYAEEDILHFDGQNWSLFFDGSDVGLGKNDLAAFSLLDPESLLLVLSAPMTLNGIRVTPQDILRFDAASLGESTAGTFSMYFDGSDVGLTSEAERLDAVSVMPNGPLLISTIGNPVVRGLSGADEDVLAFQPTSLGSTTRGTWSMYFDGSDVGLANSAGENVDALDVAPDGTIYISTVGNFSVRGLAGANEDIFVCLPISLGKQTACTYSPELFLDGSSWGLFSNNVDGFHLLEAPATPTPTATATYPSSTPTSTGTLVSIPLPANLDHEQGDFSQYSYVDTDRDDLTVSPRAGLAGTDYGLSILVDDSHRAYAYVALETASTTGLVRVRFYIDPNSLGMDHLAQVSFLYLLNSDGVTSFALMKLMRINGRYLLRGVMVDDNGVHRETGVWPITDEPHLVEIQVRRASNAASNDATFETWVDGVRKTTMTGVDSYEKFFSFQYASFGLNGIAGAVSGTYYLDEIVLKDESGEIGPRLDADPTPVPTRISAQTPTPQPTRTPTLTAANSLLVTETTTPPPTFSPP